MNFTLETTIESVLPVVIALVQDKDGDIRLQATQGDVRAMIGYLDACDGTFVAWTSNTDKLRNMGFTATECSGIQVR